MKGFKTIEEFTLTECEEFLKRNDISEEDRQRAEKQKKKLLQPEPEQPQKSILEEFPEYEFMPTSLFGGKTTKEKNYGKIPIGIGYALLLLAIVFIGLSWHYDKRSEAYKEEMMKYREQHYDNNSYEYCRDYIDMESEASDMEDRSEWMVAVGSELLTIGVIILIIGYLYRKRRYPIRAVADYYATSKIGRRDNCRIVVKARKFGVIQQSAFGMEIVKLLIPTEYDRMTWQTFQLLFAEKDGKTKLIDITGKKGTKEYDKLEWKDEKTTDILVAENDGRRFLVDAYGNILS